MHPFSAHIGYLFNDMPVELRFAQARAAGFSFVEMPSPYSVPARRVRSLCAENDLRFVQMALPSGDAAAGEKGIAALPGREAEFRASIDIGLDYAGELGVGMVHVMAGVVPAGVSRDAVMPVYVANLALLCERAAAVGITVLIEPIGIGTIANYLLDDPYQALGVLKQVGAPNLALLFDAFHTAHAGLDPIGFVRDHAASIAHVHIADYPGRHEPGTGTIDYQGFFDALDAQGYTGVIGLEYIPTTTTLAGLGWRSAYT